MPQSPDDNIEYHGPPSFWKASIGNIRDTPESPDAIVIDTYHDLNLLNDLLNQIINETTSLIADSESELAFYNLRTDVDTRLETYQIAEWPEYQLGPVKKYVSYAQYKAMEDFNTAGSAYIRRIYADKMRSASGTNCIDVINVATCIRQEALHIKDFLDDAIGSVSDSAEHRTLELAQDWAQTALNDTRAFRNFYSSQGQKLQQISETELGQITPQQARKFQAAFQVKVNLINKDLDTLTTDVQKQTGLLSEIFYKRYLGPSLKMKLKATNDLDRVTTSGGSFFSAQAQQAVQGLSIDYVNSLTDQLNRNTLYTSKVLEVKDRLAARDTYVGFIRQLSQKGGAVPNPWINTQIPGTEKDGWLNIQPPPSPVAATPPQNGQDGQDGEDGEDGVDGNNFDVYDEGVLVLSAPDILDFTGAGVTVTEHATPGHTVITIPGGGGGGDDDPWVYYDEDLYVSTILEGSGSIASADWAVAEGLFTTASNTAAHAEGSDSIASGNASHAEGQQTTASDAAAHAEGRLTIASAFYTHAEGYTTTASAQAAHAEGDLTIASGYAAHAEGQDSVASGLSAHAGASGDAIGDYSFAHGSGNYAGTDESVVLGGDGNSVDAGNSGAAILGGNGNTVTGDEAVILGGDGNEASGFHSAVIAGDGCDASGDYGAIAIGAGSESSGGYGSIASGSGAVASDESALAVGNGVVASGFASQAFGSSTAEGEYSHAEGESNVASGARAHVGGLNSTSHGSNGFVHSRFGDITAGSTECAILGGDSHDIFDNSLHCVIIGGEGNEISSAIDAGIFAAESSEIVDSGFASVILGGSDHFAQMDESGILGGSDNSLLGDGNWSAIVAGSDNVIDGTLSAFIGGGSDNITYAYESAIIGGTFGTINVLADASIICGGEGNTVNEIKSVALGGEDNTNDARYTVSMGLESVAWLKGSIAHSSSKVIGAQYVRATGNIQTTNATPTPLQGAEFADSIITFDDFNHTVTIEGYITARRTDVRGTASTWRYEALIDGDGSTAYRFVGASPTITLVEQDAAAATWVVAIAITGLEVDFTVTGEAAKTIDWHATVNIHEIR